MRDAWQVKEAIDSETGTVHRFYTYKRKPCKRIVLETHLSKQLAGYLLIEKDLRSIAIWLTEIEKLHPMAGDRKDARNKRGENREVFNLVKGLFVAALTFYGKCFTKCEGRRVKLERVHISPEFHDMHDECMSLRHNFAAHSGAKMIERAQVVLVLPPKQQKTAAPCLYREVDQPDMILSAEGEASFSELVEHARLIAEKKITALNEKIMREQVIPLGYTHWDRQ